MKEHFVRAVLVASFGILPTFAFAGAAHSGGGVFGCSAECMSIDAYGQMTDVGVTFGVGENPLDAFQDLTENCKKSLWNQCLDESRATLVKDFLDYARPFDPEVCGDISSEKQLEYLQKETKRDYSDRYCGSGTPLGIISQI